MAWRRIVSRHSIGFLLLPLLVGCQTTAPHAYITSPVFTTVPSSLRVPVNVERLAILYPKTYKQELVEAYARLESSVFQLKEQRPFLRIVDRFHLATILGEQRLQVGGLVRDETAIGLGRVLGVDCILLYRIEGPTMRDRILARHYGQLPPMVVTSKVIMVESAEVVYHNVVSVPVGRQGTPTPFFLSDPQFDLQTREALERGVAQTVADLRHAFR